MADEAKSEAKIVDGKLVHSNVTQKVFSGLEKGKLSTVNAILLHQTGSSSADSTFSSYKTAGHGAHFLIAKDGTIYQTARVNQKTHHVGKIRSRCYENKSCSKDELKKVKDILFKKGESYSLRLKNLHKHEKSKDYPSRYPGNEDSLGIEIVGKFDSKSKKYENVSKDQNSSLEWLLKALYKTLSLEDDDVYRHPDVSYKQSSEASSATIAK